MLTVKELASVKKFEAVKAVAQRIGKDGGNLLIVGGWVRDNSLGKLPTDMDLFLANVRPEDGGRYFDNWTPVHRNVPVFNGTIDGERYEISLPRIETSIGTSKKDFEFEVLYGVLLDLIFKDAQRRDFTINALYMDLLNMEVIDGTGYGKADLHRGTIRNCSKKFPESPERLLRAYALMSKTGFQFTNELELILEGMSLDDIPIEQVWKQGWSKIVVGQHLYPTLLNMVKLYPIFHKLSLVQQSKKWHREGNVLKHSCMTTKFYQEDPIMAAIALVHDMGKWEYTDHSTEDYHAYGHENSIRPYEVLETMGFPIGKMDLAKAVIQNHMKKPETFKAARRIALNNPYWKEVLDFMIADSFGRIPQGLSDGVRIYNYVKELSESPQVPLVSGDDIMALFGIKPSRLVGGYKQFCLDLQAEGKSKEEIITLLKEEHAKW